MRNTPIHDGYNADLLALMPDSRSRVIEVGCSSGALAHAFLATHPNADYIGIEVDPEYAEVARRFWKRTPLANVETMDDDRFATLFPPDCWVFGDVLEHLYDPRLMLQGFARW